MDATAPNPSYRAHWNLRETPFGGGLNPRYFFPSPAHDEALARLHFLVEHHQRLGLLLGSTGTGKSLVLDVLARDMRRFGAQVANISKNDRGAKKLKNDSRRRDSVKRRPIAFHAGHVIR